MTSAVIDESTIAWAVRLLREAAPNADVFLFGSYARGEAKEESDLDLLVVEPDVGCRRNEIAHLPRSFGRWEFLPISW